ncbi:MAG: DUF1588 domain-containing protein, partial [Proteobacteria bacterium]
EEREALRAQNDAINKDLLSKGKANPNNIIEHWNEVASVAGGTCMTCHSRINPAGFPLETLAPNGSVRTTYADGGGDIKYSGTFGGRAVASVTDLVDTIRASTAYTGCANTKLFSYLVGLNVAMAPARSGVSLAALRAQGLQDAFASITASDAFMTKSGAE